jgi:carbon monoxide dehydrogenase subunit G
VIAGMPGTSSCTACNRRRTGLGSSAEGEARWQVIDGVANDAVVVVSLTWRLTGPLAQFNRSGLIQDIVRRLAATFAINLEASMATGRRLRPHPGTSTLLRCSGRLSRPDCSEGD